MEYKGYKARVEFDSDANLFHGQVLGLRDVITLQGTSVDNLWEGFKASVDDYLEWCAELGEEPDKPFSGKFIVRIEPELHKAIAIKAELEGKSLNAWVTEALEGAIKQQPAHETSTTVVSTVLGEHTLPL